VAKLSKIEERRHAQACQLVDLPRDLTEDERWFVLRHWQESSTTANGLQGAFFTPEGLAGDMSLEVGGDRIIDLGAGIGRLAWHNRELFGRWPHPAPEFLCVERNPAYVRVGRKVLPEATWLCADILDLPDLADQLGGVFDCAISNPPFGPLPRHRNAPGYTGRRFEYHTIAIAARLAHRGVFIVPQTSAPFRYSGRPNFEPDQGDTEYARFTAGTGITLTATCGIDTSSYDHQWRGVSPRVEIVKADFRQHVAATATPGTRARSAARDWGDQLTLLSL
jgi:hypothetical protein